MTNPWIEFIPPPRPRAADLKWDIFISYRSVNRAWAIALYDMLIDAGYRVFLDQFVLAAGAPLVTKLGQHLAASASGVLLWSNAAADSKWVDAEYNMMHARALNSQGEEFPFHFVIAKLDQQKLPPLASASVYVEFHDYPDGPTGIELVRLIHGLAGNPLPSKVAHAALAHDLEMREEPTTIRALAASKQWAAIEQRATCDSATYGTAARLPALAAEKLIAGKQYEAALRVIDRARKRFRSSLRLKQLQGLALRRLKRIGDAALVLEMLHAAGHRDPETLGILAAVWADRWESLPEDTQEKRDALERSRDLYRGAFDATPSDTYVGINAASKSAMLGELDVGRAIAKSVLTRLDEMTAERGGGPSSDYWERVTEPEAKLLLGEWDQALSLYHQARIAHQTEVGSIGSTWTQIRRLIGPLGMPPEVEKKLRAEFSAVAGAH